MACNCSLLFTVCSALRAQSAAAQREDRFAGDDAMRNARRERSDATEQPTTAAVAADRGLARLVAQLLETPVRRLHLPSGLMKLYLESRWDSRRDLLVAWALAMAAINALCAAFDPFAAPAGVVPLVLLGRVAISAIFLACAATIRGMARTGREGAVVIAACVAMVLIAGGCGLLGGPEFMERILAEAMFGGAVALVLARIAWRETVILAGLLIVSLLSLMAVAPAPGLGEKAQLVVFYGAAIVGLTVARQAQNRFLYHVFLRGLSERLKMTEVERMNGRLSTMARTDPLTTLANRRHFDEVFEALTAATDSERSLALFMIDIDCFKALNDDLGHAAGDDCLRIAAALIRGELREEQDLLARFGGEEFVALLPDIAPAEACSVAERVCAAVSRRKLSNPGAKGGVVTVSVGVSLSPPADVADLIAEADAALYEAKSLGRNQVRVARAAKIVEVAQWGASPRIAAAEAPR